MLTTREQLEAAGREAKYPKGQSADPTSNMSPEAKAKWDAMNDEHGGKFKTGNGDMLQYFADNPDKLREKQMRDEAKGKKATPLDKLAMMELDLVEGTIPEIALDRDLEALELQGRLAALDVAANSQIGKTIIDQMGGMRAMRMIGAKQIIWLKDGVGVRWPNKQRSKGNYFEVKLTPADEYDLEFFNLTTRAKKSVKKYRGVLWDQLAELFDKQTGWYLRMADQQKALVARGDEQVAKFEEGEDADPTENMSEEDAKKWRLENLKNKDKFTGKEAAGWSPGDAATWRGKKVMVVDTHGYPVKTVDLRWTESGTGGSKNEVSGHKRKVPVSQIKKRAASGYLLSIAPDGSPQVDSFVDEVLFSMILAKIHRLRPNQVKPMGRQVSVNGKRMTWQEALQAAYQTYAGESTSGHFELPPGRAVRVNVKVDSTYEQGMRSAAVRVAKAAGHKTYKDYVRDWKALQYPVSVKGKMLSEKEWAKLMGKQATWEGGSRAPDGWDNGTIEGDPSATESDEGSDTPDGRGNVDKRAAAPGTIELHALVHNGGVVGVTDKWRGYADTWSYWTYGDRKLLPEEARDEARVVDLYNVPMATAEQLIDVGTRASRLTPQAAMRLARPFMKDKGHKVAADKTARSGLYGHTKKVQADCESCVRKVQKAAHRIARSAYGRNEKVAEFLSTHASRSDSLPAHILVAALGEIGPKVAADMQKAARLAELRAARGFKVEAAAPRGKAQVAIMKHLEQADAGFTKELSDIARGAAFRGIHFAKIMSAAEALKKKGLIGWDGVKVTKKAADKTAASISQVFSKFPSKFRRKGKGGKHEVHWMSGEWAVLEDLSAADLNKMWTALSWEPGKTASDKEARSYGLYGFTEKVAKLGLSACSDVRAEAGRIAYDLHRRRSAKHSQITAFLDTHCKTAECRYSKLLATSYPEASKTASDETPRTVQAWLEWEE